MNPSAAELQFLLKMRDDATRVLRMARDRMRELAKETSTGVQQFKNFRMVMTELNQSVEVLQKSWAFLSRTVGGALNTFREYEKSMTATQRLAKMSDAEMTSFGRSFDKLTAKIRAVPVERLNQLGEQAARSGVKGSAGIEQFITRMGELETVLQGMGDDAPEMILRTLNVTGEGIAGLNKFNNVLVSMAQITPNSERAILRLATELSAATAEFDLSIEGILGFSAAAAGLGVQPELFGTTMQRVFRRLDAAARTNSVAMRTLTGITGMTADGFKSLIDNSPEKALVKFLEVLEALNAAGLDTSGFLAQFGLDTDEHMKVLVAAGINVEQYRQALSDAANEGGRLTAVTEALAKVNDDYGTQVNATRSAWVLLKKEIGEAMAPVASAVLGELEEILISLRVQLDSMPSWTAGILTWSAVAIPAFGAVAFAAAGVARALALMGAGGVFTILRSLILVVAVLTKGFLLLGLAVAKTVVGLGIFGAMRFASLIAATGTIALNLGAILLSGLRVAAVVAVFGRFGAILLPIIATIGRIVLGISALVAAVGAVPLLIGAALAAMVAGIYIYMDELKAFFSQTWSQIADDISTWFVQGVQSGIEGAKNLMSDFKNWWSDDSSALPPASPTVGSTQVPGGPIVGPGQTYDTSGVSAFLEADRDVIATIDNFSEVKARINEMRRSVEALQALPKTDSYFKELGLNPDDVDDYRARIEALVNLAERKGDPIAMRKKALIEELQAARAITGESRNQLEIATATAELMEELGTDSTRTLGKAVIAQITDVLTALQTARREASVADFTYDTTKQVEQGMAITKDQKNRLAIIQAIGDKQRELGTFEDEQIERMRALMLLLQQVEKNSAYTIRATELNNQLELGAAILGSQRDQLAITQELNRYERENGELSAERRKEMEGQLSALRLMSAIQSAVSALDPRASAFITAQDQMEALKSAVESGAITQEYFNQLVKQLNQNLKEALDPLYRMRETLRENVELQSLMGPGAEAERDALQRINELRRMGYDLTQEQIGAVREMSSAMADLALVQSSGFEAWADEIGTVAGRVLDMQTSLADSFSSTLVDSIYGAEGAWSDFMLNASKMFTKFFIDTALQQFAKNMGNDMGGLLSGLGIPTQKSAQDRAKAAQQNLDNVLQQIVKADTVNITANTLNLNDIAQGAMSNAGLGNEISGGAGSTNSAGGVGRDILNLIRQAEGTSGSNGYNTSLANGQFLPGNQEQMLTQKTLREILQLQKGMLAQPDNVFNSSALGAYQIIGTTLGGESMDGSGGLIKQLGLSLDDKFTPELQDRLAIHLLKGREGQGVAGLRKEWQGLKEIDASVIEQAQRAGVSAGLAAASPVGNFGVRGNPSMNPLFGMDGASSLTNPNAAAAMKSVLDGPFQQMQSMFGKALTINDAIAKAGTSREHNRTGSRHFDGDALDISLAGMNNADKQKLVQSALGSGFSGIGFGQNIMHADMGPRRAWGYGNSEFGGKPLSEMINMVKQYQPSANTNSAPSLIGGAGSDNLAGAGGADLLAQTQQLAQAQQAAATAMQTVNGNTLTFGNNLETTGMKMQVGGQNVLQFGATVNQAGTQTQMATNQLGQMGTQAQMAAIGTQQAGASTSRLGQEASSAAPRINQASAALKSAGGAGGGGGFFSGGIGASIGGAVISAGIGLLTKKLSGDPNKKTVTTTYSPSTRNGDALPKYHDGLTSREYMAVLERGERVLTEKDSKRTEDTLARLTGIVANQARAPEKTSGPTMIMQVNTPDAASFKKAQSTTMATAYAGMSRAAQRRG